MEEYMVSEGRESVPGQTHTNGLVYIYFFFWQFILISSTEIVLRAHATENNANNTYLFAVFG